MPDSQSPSEVKLETRIIERYGLLLSQTQLAELLGRSPGGLRYSLSYPSDLQTRALKACGRRIGRRVYYPAAEVAQIINYTPRRVICTLCGSIHVEAMHWVSGKRQFTCTLMVTLATWARGLTWKQVAKPFTASGVRWKLPSMKPWPTA